MELSIFSKSGEDTGRKAQLNDTVFGIEPHSHAVYLDVKRILASRRQGTHSTKERNEVKGSTKKLRKQKGSGAARVGDIKNPLFRGGGTIFGPKPRKYTQYLNKKVRRLALKSAFSDAASKEKVIVLEDLSVEKPSTKVIKELLVKLSCDGHKVALVLGEHDVNVYKSSSNIDKLKYYTAKDLNTYEVMNCNKMLITESALEAINNK